jgi:hypothetical protein
MDLRPLATRHTPNSKHAATRQGAKQSRRHVRAYSTSNAAAGLCKPARSAKVEHGTIQHCTPATARPGKQPKRICRPPQPRTFAHPTNNNTQRQAKHHRSHAHVHGYSARCTCTSSVAYKSSQIQLPARNAPHSQHDDDDQDTPAPARTNGVRRSSKELYHYMQSQATALLRSW